MALCLSLGLSACGQASSNRVGGALVGPQALGQSATQAAKAGSAQGEASFSPRHRLRFVASDSLKRYNQLNLAWEAAWTAKGRDQKEAAMLGEAKASMLKLSELCAQDPSLAGVGQKLAKQMKLVADLEDRWQATSGEASQREVMHELLILVTGTLQELVYG